MGLCYFDSPHYLLSGYAHIQIVACVFLACRLVISTLQNWKSKNAVPEMGPKRVFALDSLHLCNLSAFSQTTNISGILQVFSVRPETAKREPDNQSGSISTKTKASSNPKPQPEGLQPSNSLLAAALLAQRRHGEVAG